MKVTAALFMIAGAAVASPVPAPNPVAEPLPMPTPVSVKPP